MVRDYFYRIYNAAAASAFGSHSLSIDSFNALPTHSEEFTEVLASCIKSGHYGPASALLYFADVREVETFAKLIHSICLR